MSVDKIMIYLYIDPIEKASEEAIRRIFLDSQEDLRPLLPDYWQSYLSGSDSKSRRAAWSSSIKKPDPATSRPAQVSTGAVSAPRAIHSRDPKYTKEAASLHI